MTEKVSDERKLEIEMRARAFELALEEAQCITDILDKDAFKQLVTEIFIYLTEGKWDT